MKGGGSSTKQPDNMLSAATPSDRRANPTNRPRPREVPWPSHDRRVVERAGNAVSGGMSLSLAAASATELKSSVGVFGAERERVQVEGRRVVAHERAHVL